LCAAARKSEWSHTAAERDRRVIENEAAIRECNDESMKANKNEVISPERRAKMKRQCHDN
jgi:hypothetical protein